MTWTLRFVIAIESRLKNASIAFAFENALPENK